MQEWRHDRPPQVLLVHHLKALKLPTFLREYDKIAGQCASEGVDYPRYLLLLAEAVDLDRIANLQIVVHFEHPPPSAKRGTGLPVDGVLLWRNRPTRLPH